MYITFVAIFVLAVLDFHCGRFSLTCGRFGRGRFRCNSGGDIVA